MLPTSENTPASDQRNDSDDQNGANLQNAPAQAPQPTPGHGNKSPQYGEFGHAASAATSANNETSQTQGGQAAPSIAYPEQRGSTPQNLDPSIVRKVEDAEYDEQREGWAKDDPRYGGGTRNWNTAEPANRSTGPAPDADETPHNPNAGNNDNPDEFSALRPDGGSGIPGK